MLSFFPLVVSDEIWDLIESVSEGFPTYSCKNQVIKRLPIHHSADYTFSGPFGILD